MFRQLEVTVNEDLYFKNNTINYFKTRRRMIMVPVRIFHSLFIIVERELRTALAPWRALPFKRWMSLSIEIVRVPVHDRQLSAVEVVGESYCKLDIIIIRYECHYCLGIRINNPNYGYILGWLKRWWAYIHKRININYWSR